MNTCSVDHGHRQSRAVTSSISQADRQADIEEYSDKSAQYTNIARLDACIDNTR